MMAVVGYRSGALVAVAMFTFIVALAAFQGGYFPIAWGWASLFIGWVTAMVLLIKGRIDLGRLELAWLALLALLAAWIGLSILWSSDVPQSVLELQRAVLYVLGPVCLLIGVRAAAVPHLLGGLFAAIVATCTLALASRFFPAQQVVLDEITVNRLSWPLQYWNALGAFAATGTLLALGLAARARSAIARIAPASALPILLTTVYFTYSRGAWGALALGLVAMLALDPRRLQLATTLLALAPLSVAAVLTSARQPGLTSLTASYDLTAREGRQMAVIILALAVGSGAVALALGLVAARVRPSRFVRIAYGATLAAIVALALVAVVGRYGGPVALADTAYHSFKEDRPAPPAPSAARRSDLNQRLFTLRSNGRLDYWTAAWDQHRLAPWLGAGAGSFEQHWLSERTFYSQVRDAHSLYAESLGEIGWIGFALLVAALGLPAAVALRRRGATPFVPVAFGAYVGFVVHAGVDWDWEVPVLMLAGLACGTALVRSTPAGEDALPPLAVGGVARAGALVALIALAVFSVVGIVGNRALAASRDAADAGRWPAATAQAQTAVRWAPWSGGGWQVIGQADYDAGRLGPARAALLEAARRDPSEWRIQYDLGFASRGRARRRAFVRAALMNPLHPNIEALRQQGASLPPAPAITR